MAEQMTKCVARGQHVDVGGHPSVRGLHLTSLRHWMAERNGIPCPIVREPIWSMCRPTTSRWIFRQKSWNGNAGSGTKVIHFNPGNGAVKAFNAADGKLAWTRPQSTPSTGG